MTDSGATTPPLGTFGVWRTAYGLTPRQGTEIEKLGYGTLWVGGSPAADLGIVEELLDATDHLTIATGIVNIWTAPAADIAESYHRIERRHPGRFLLGIGVGHREQGQAYRAPYASLIEYLDVLDAAGVPSERRVLAALGPKVLELSATRAAGAHPYLTTPRHTHDARAILGPDKILAPEEKVMLGTDPAVARPIGRDAVENPYLHLRNYVNNLKRLGYRDEDLADGGSDALIDALVAHGDAPAVAGQLRLHLDAGADHVAIQVLPAPDDPIPALRELAAELGI
ncbi:LLM class F420-dependent oxidoreductase [Rhodococcus triatomae]|uniref:Probable F420-dependent oxidoreductase, MSMEG_4141 family n=1 Tax=Rhodococcus triatomae TaxID=300028 RepID=A0A1G8L013_9NOCA|nr:LLM class F420-dependent oxidoreductase [Rhodococcus triatomae]QNG20471.1 LLM class F420-dependent oxidoreductase [Rhodococcus triatomae]QNG23611.1 LLM class F420-dependent oxidoreductase [Rhodococcus triatomae]SDI48973.1 probable F420-dependent oxidoreductase, MSMEG_4141 family [Rhodococcus triatomae]